MADDPIGVFVEARNDDGNYEEGYGWGPTTDDAIAQVIDEIIERTGDDSFVMNEWRPA